jgi:hypothetical protein
MESTSVPVPMSWRAGKPVIFKVSQVITSTGCAGGNHAHFARTDGADFHGRSFMRLTGHAMAIEGVSGSLPVPPATGLRLQDPPDGSRQRFRRYGRTATCFLPFHCHACYPLFRRFQYLGL